MRKWKTIGKLVSEKQIAYGDSFSQSVKVIEVLYPNGISKEQTKDFLTVIRVIDKLFRIAIRRTMMMSRPWGVSWILYIESLERFTG